MLRKIKIENFRGFKSFELNNLGRVNLLVGTNNSGKTSILEAIQLLCSRNNLQPLVNAMNDRGEYLWTEGKRERELDIRHLFHGHYIEIGNGFSVLGIYEDNSEYNFSVKLGSQLNKPLNGNEEFNYGLEELREIDILLTWIDNDRETTARYFISNQGGLSEPFLHQPPRTVMMDGTVYIEPKTQFVTASALSSEKAIELFDRIVLTPEETILQEALQTIEPKIERIASVGADKYRRSQSRGGFLVRLSGHDRPVPIGSMGDGIWRMLGLALAAVGAENGYLFIDEIDTGLHYSTMSDMWKMIWETAKRLNIQVFATTHSNDCWNSLASIASREDIAGDGITIQRIERDKNVAVAFNEREIVVAADRGIEVR